MVNGPPLYFYSLSDRIAPLRLLAASRIWGGLGLVVARTVKPNSSFSSIPRRRGMRHRAWLDMPLVRKLPAQPAYN
jgi:hypothetical protein